MKQIDRTNVTIEVDGVTYEGWFKTSQGFVTVHTPYGSKSTQMGASPPEA